MPAKASAGTDVMPLPARCSVPPSAGQEPERTSGAPAKSPLKVQLPNSNVHGIDMHVTEPCTKVIFAFDWAVNGTHNS